MRKSIYNVSLVGSLLVAMSAMNLFADEAESKSSNISAALASGRTLPQNVLKANVQTNSMIGKSKAFGTEGKSTTVPGDHSVHATTAIIEYGILDSLSAQVAVPFVVQNESTVAGTTVKRQTGISDMKAGVLYNFFDNDMFVVSAGLGMRFATGQYADVAPLTGTGRGSNDLGLRLNLDFQPVTGLWLSLQDQEEVQVSSVEHKALKTHFDKKGISRDSFAQAAYNLGGLTDALKAFSVKGRYAFKYDTAVNSRELKKEVRKATTQHSAGFGAGIDTRAYGLPLALETMYMMPVAGTTTVSPDLEVKLSAYVQI